MRRLSTRKRWIRMFVGQMRVFALVHVFAPAVQDRNCVIRACNNVSVNTILQTSTFLSIWSIDSMVVITKFVTKWNEYVYSCMIRCCRNGLPGGTDTLYNMHQSHLCEIVLRINTNQEKLHRMRMGANISLKIPSPCYCSFLVQWIHVDVVFPL